MRENCDILAVPRTVLVIRTLITAVLEPTAKPSHAAAHVLRKVRGILRTIFIKLV
jgi:hypothetical protein